tara:strand:- start:702 stop:899 length:198 start_codon:yes stop_codon:yes gene_type:complete
MNHFKMKEPSKSCYYKVMRIHFDLDVCLSLTFGGFPYAYLSAKVINKKTPEVDFRSFEFWRLKRN